jgi:hypothetical protein
VPNPDCTACDGTGVWPCVVTGSTDELCNEDRLPDGSCALMCGPCLPCEDFDAPVVIPGQLTMFDSVSEHAV